MQLTKIKKIILDNSLNELPNLLQFLEDNWSKYDEIDLRDIAEYANANRQKNSAYYTDSFIVNDIIESLPILNKSKISVLEPAVGTGNFLLPFIKKFSSVYKEITITVNDIDNDSLKVTKFFLSKHIIPKNIHINYSNYDFLGDLFFVNNTEYDYVIGNPPFQRISEKNAQEYGNHVTNLAGQFLLKAASIANIVGLVMPKNFLSTKDYEEARDRVSTLSIDAIIDFGEKGFKGVLIETIALIISKHGKDAVNIKSYIDNTDREVSQKYITDKKYPVWLVYRNKQFDKIAANMQFNIFKVFRDRQITNSILSDKGDIRVIKSRNIKRDGSGLKKIKGYDAYISKTDAKKLRVMNYFSDKDVYLVPNMTYYPRMIKKQSNYIVNGSVAILKLKPEKSINSKQVRFFATDTFNKFYRIARNKGTRSLNIDSTSIFWFGKILSENIINIGEQS